MDNVKKFEDFLDRMQGLLDNAKKQGYILVRVEDLENAFPELKEREDGEIRKDIVDFINRVYERQALIITDEERDNWIAWLEKQGGQTSAQTNEYIETKGLSEIEAEAEELTKEISDEKHNLTDFECELLDICRGWIGEEVGWKEYIKDNADVLLKIAIKKYNSIKDVPFEQQPAWSEEEERIYKSITYSFAHNYPLTVQQQEFVKSLRPQPKQEWSEEDEKMLNDILMCGEHHCYLDAGNIAWLKSLKPQKYVGYNPYKATVESIAEMCKHYDKASHSGLRDFYDNVKIKCKDAKEYDNIYPQNTWKPSEEQMEALEHFVRGVGKSGYASPYDNNTKLLYSLLQDLKKLKEK